MSPQWQFEPGFERPKICTQSGAGASTEYGSKPRLPAKVMRFKSPETPNLNQLTMVRRALVSVNMKDRCVEYYDSLSGPVETMGATTILHNVSMLPT
jgi:hypothetical protein